MLAERGTNMNRDLILHARRASVEEYLKGKGEILLKEGRQYRVKRYPGLVVSGNKWYSHTLLKGGNTLDYLVEMEGMDFKKAVMTLSQESICDIKPIELCSQKALSIPERNENDKRVLAYLVKTRGIKAEVIIPLLKQGRIYESVGTHNAVFTGIDEEKRIRYVMQRSTLPGNSLKFESNGSDKKYSFSLAGKIDRLLLFESPIDLLSYLSIKNGDMRSKPHMLSLAGVSDIALDAYLSRIPGIREIIFCLDNDKAGNAACELLRDRYARRGLQVDRHLPERKDWNEDLLSGIVINSQIDMHSSS